ncbi:MAG: hypothetical protein L3K07_02675 [Thermoplasmata archaeon]|nr:hypothetical protein [Thermoplasmata archaeon]
MEPTYRTGVLWAVLALLLLFGTVASAFVVWAITDLYTAHRFWLDLPVLAVAIVVATVLLLLLAGILYRVDRLRGEPHRRVELFE